MKKIGFAAGIKFNIELSRTSGGGVVRQEVLLGLKQRADVRVVTPPSSNALDWLLTHDIEVNPSAEGLDALVVEGFNPEPNIFYKESLDALYAALWPYRGLVLYVMHDIEFWPTLQPAKFVTLPEEMKPDPDKRFIIATFAKRVKAFIGAMPEKHRLSFSNVGVSKVYACAVEQACASLADLPPRLTTSSDIKLLYIGNKRWGYRSEQLNRYYGGEAAKFATIVGNWDRNPVAGARLCEKVKEETVLDRYNHAVATVFVTDDSMRDLHYFPKRFYELFASGTLVLFAHDSQPVQCYPQLERWAVKDSNGVVNWLRDLQGDPYWRLEEIAKQKAFFRSIRPTELLGSRLYTALEDYAWTT